MKSRIAPSTAARAGLALAVAVFACLAATPPAQSYYDEFGCGIYGTDLYPGEHCPVGPKRHSWSEVTAYRNNGRGQNRMCEAVYRDHNGAQLQPAVQLRGDQHLGAARRAAERSLPVEELQRPRQPVRRDR